jgi:hypothetical protein
MISPGAVIAGSIPLIAAAIDLKSPDGAQWLLAVGGALVSVAGYLWLIRRAWEAIQDQDTRTTSGQVLREHFFFPWTLVAIWRYFAAYANNYNQFIERSQWDLPYMGSAASNLFVLVPFLGFPILLLPTTSMEERQNQVICFLSLVAVLMIIYVVMISRICDAVNDINEYRSMLEGSENAGEEGQK